MNSCYSIALATLCVCDMTFVHSYDPVPAMMGPVGKVMKMFNVDQLLVTSDRII